MILTDIYLAFEDEGVQNDAGGAEPLLPGYSALELETTDGRDAMMLRLYNATSDSDVKTRLKAYEVFNYVCTANYIHLNNYAPMLAQRSITALHSEEDSVLIQILAVWTSIAEMETALEERDAPHHGFIANYAPQLVPVLLEVTSNSKDSCYVEMQFTPPQNPQMAAFLALWAFSKVLPGDTILPLLSTFIGQYLPTTCKDWNLRKAAIMALTVLAPFEEAHTLLNSSIGLIIDAGLTHLNSNIPSTSTPQSGTTHNTLDSVHSSSPLTSICLSVSDSASFALQRISEFWPMIIEDRWAEIVQWMAKLNISNRSEYVILSHLLDALNLFISFNDESLDVLESLAKHVPQLLTLLELWTSNQENLNAIPQFKSVLETFETLSDLLCDQTDLLDKEKYEGICLNVLEHLESIPTQHSRLTGSMFGIFNIGSFEALTMETSSRAIRTCLNRVQSSSHMEEIQESLILLVSAVTVLDDKFSPFVEQTCELIVHILEQHGVFNEDDELSIIAVTELMPEEEDVVDDDDEEEEKLFVVTTLGDLDDLDDLDGDVKKKPVVERTQRQADLLKSIRITAKNLALEDALRLLEQLMGAVSPQQTEPFVKNIQISLFQLALRVPSTFTSVLAPLALALASTIRSHPNTANVGLRPLIKLIEQIAKTIAGKPDDFQIYPSLLTAFQSAILFANADQMNHIAIITDAFEQMITIIKAALKDENATSENYRLAAQLIGDYVSVVKVPNSTHLERLLSTFEMIGSNWDDPNPDVLIFVKGHLDAAQRAIKKSSSSNAQAV
jgi:hypothetical protein